MACGNELQFAIALAAAQRCPTMVESLRALRDRGAAKSDVVAWITRGTEGKPFLRSVLLILVDETWKED